MLKIQEVGKRGVIFKNDRGEINYLIKGNQSLILCDTSSYGSCQMKMIEHYIKEQGLSHKQLVIFNTHADYDHIWGNAYFMDAVIISSQACLEDMKERAEFELEVFKDLQIDSVEIKYPNLTFDKTLTLHEDGIQFIYTPGHTIGCAICLDHKEKIAFVGDLIEEPIPYLSYHRLDIYLETLDYLKTLNYTLINGHNGIVDLDLIEDNQTYIQNVLNQNEVEINDDIKWLHNHNINDLLLNKHLEQSKTIANWNYRDDQVELWKKLKSYFSLHDSQLYNIQALNHKELKQFLMNLNK